MAKVHGVSSQRRITAEAAVDVARSIQALATPSRVRLLGRLREGACSVSELTHAVDMEQPAVSHQLRILRDLGLGAPPTPMRTPSTTTLTSSTSTSTTTPPMSTLTSTRKDSKRSTTTSSEGVPTRSRRHCDPSCGR